MALVSSLCFGFQGQRKAMFYYPVDPSEKYGVFAVRMGNYKAHYYTMGEFYSKTVNAFVCSSTCHILHTPRTTTFCPFLCLRSGTQWNNSRSGLSCNLPTEVSRPSSAVWPGVWPIWKLQPEREWSSRAGQRSAEHQGPQGQVWGLDAIWRKWDRERNWS